jgi:DNA end-binding protein Ku
VKLAVQLIEQISVDEFDPTQFEDAVRKRIEAAVEQKIEGQEIQVAPIGPEASGGGQVIDLMQALRESLSKAPKRPAAAAPAPVRPAAAPTPAPVAKAKAERKPAKRATADEAPAPKARARKSG